MKDQDLDKLLQELTLSAPKAEQIQQWKSSVFKEQTRLQRGKRVQWLPLAFAAGVGFVLGSVFQFDWKSESQHKKNYELENATIEYVYIKN